MQSLKEERMKDGTIIPYPLELKHQRKLNFALCGGLEGT
jgi:hypothetical protein